MAMEEIWKDIKDYEGLYQVSNLGKVKSLERDVYNPRYGIKHLKEKILKAAIAGTGHLCVYLCKDGVRKYCQVHQLVAQAFIPNPENKTDVHHIDHDKTNNRVDNLMWVTKSQHVVLHPEIYKASVKTHSISIYQIDKTNGCIIREWSSMTDVERELGIDHRKICDCCKGKRKSTGGFIWKYA